MAIRVAASLLGCNFKKLDAEVKAVLKAGVDILHVDVMDGVFVSMKTPFLDAALTKRIKKTAGKTPVDVHLMVQKPLLVVDDFLNAGADMISVHVEADDFDQALVKVKSAGKKAGIVINPKTPVDAILPYLSQVSFVLVMSVVPGKGGQSYLTEVNDKIDTLKEEILEKNRSVFIEVDGGIKKENYDLPVNAGADVLVVGTGIFHEKEYAAVVQQLKTVLSLGADHAGYQLKENLKAYLREHHIAFQDFGSVFDPKDDYPDVAHTVAHEVAQSQGKGLLICGSGTGVSIAANKVSGVRAAALLSEDRVLLARLHNDLNILCLPGMVFPDLKKEIASGKYENLLSLHSEMFPLAQAKKLVDVFLRTPFEGGRHERRVQKIETVGKVAKKIEKADR